MFAVERTFIHISTQCFIAFSVFQSLLIYTMNREQLGLNATHVWHLLENSLSFFVCKATFNELQCFIYSPDSMESFFIEYSLLFKCNVQFVVVVFFLLLFFSTEIQSQCECDKIGEYIEWLNQLATQYTFMLVRDQ